MGANPTRKRPSSHSCRLPVQVSACVRFLRPDIRGAHAPGERGERESVGRCRVLRKAILAALARA